MIPRGFDRPLYVLPFDHRGSFETGMFGWKGALTSEQTAQIAATKQVIYDGFKTAVAAGVQKSFFELERNQKIRDLTRLLAAGYQESTLESTSAGAVAEADMFQAELDYRSAYTQLKRLVEGR